MNAFRSHSGIWSGTVPHIAEVFLLHQVKELFVRQGLFCGLVARTGSEGDQGQNCQCLSYHFIASSFLIAF